MKVQFAGRCQSRPHATMQSDALARERRPLASPPGGGRHRCAKRGERDEPQTAAWLPTPRIPTRHHDAPARERRPPVGTAARSAANSAVLIEQGVRHSRRYGAPSSALVSRSRACRPETGAPLSRAILRSRGSRVGLHFHSKGGAALTLAGGGVVGAGFALPRDAGRRPALHVGVILRGWGCVGSQQ